MSSVKEFNGPAHLTSLDRREFMKYLGLFSSMTLLSTCAKKAEHLVPFVQEVPEFSHENFEFYSSAFNCEGFAQGILVKSYQGRPVKIEGHPTHPFSLGSTGPQAQATLYELYHPERARSFRWKSKEVSLTELEGLIIQEKNNWNDGSGVAFVVPPDHSPTQKRLISELRARLPRSNWSTLSPWARERFTTFDLQLADTVVSFDEELFDLRPDALRLSQDFMARRRRAMENNNPMEMNRLISFHSFSTLTSAKADEAHQMTPEEIWNEACDLLTELEGGDSKNERIKRLAKILRSRGKSVVTLSTSLDPQASELEARINKTLSPQLLRSFSFPLSVNLSSQKLKKKVENDEVHTLIVMDSDILYWDPDWKQLFPKIKHKIGLSLFDNETYNSCDSKLPLGHFLEHWGDLETPDGNITLQQPLITPLFPSLSPVEFFSLLVSGRSVGREEVKKTYQKRWNPQEFEKEWEETLQGGVIPNNQGQIVRPSLIRQEFKKKTLLPGFKLRILPDPSLRYGQYANNPILQELPKHFSRLTWSNAFYLSRLNAHDLQIQTGDVIRLKTDKVTMEGPVWVSDLVQKDQIITTMGYGQSRGTPIARGRGFNAFRLLGNNVLGIEKTKKKRSLAFVRQLTELGPETPIQEVNFPVTENLKANPTKPESLYPDHPLPSQQEGPQWAMTIDLTTCIGCQACVVACQTENNVPFVGEIEARKDRTMHWLRVDTYLKGRDIFFQPVPCMHCEKAPCEVVCPVNATLHGNGGLNEMIYNRCVGTRYCSNNCPYSVRRFNFRAYSSLPQPWNMGFNPEVSVRERGVMEKCTYCIQRIKQGERRKTQVQTACQQVCPTRAIEFADLKDKDSLLVKNKEGQRNYDLLGELGTVPRTSYLKVIRISSEEAKP